MTNIRAYWEAFAEAFAHPLTADGQLSCFVRNSEVIGTYAEAWVRFMAARLLPDLRVSTGAIIRTSDEGGDLRAIPQCDLIVWDPRELPPLFEQGDFAVVHTQAARGLIEVKRSLKNRTLAEKRLGSLRGRLLSEYRRNVIAVVMSHHLPLFAEIATPDWPSKRSASDPPAFTRLLSGKGSPRADTNGVWAFIYFVLHVGKSKPPRTVG